MGHEQTGLYSFLPTQVCITTARVRKALSAVDLSLSPAAQMLPNDLDFFRKHHGARFNGAVSDIS